MKTVTGLLLLDVDGTLIQEEVINLLGKEAGQEEEIIAITAAAMAGQLDFKTALVQRVSLLAGLPTSVFEKVSQSLHLHKGAKKLITEMKKRGYKIGLVSGGFHEIIDDLAATLEIDYVKANHLEINCGRLTGSVIGKVVTQQTKVDCLKRWADENGLRLSQTIAVGDGANDLLMVQQAGLGIAYCAKPVLKEVADDHIDQPDLGLVLDCLDSYPVSPRKRQA